MFRKALIAMSPTRREENTDKDFRIENKKRSFLTTAGTPAVGIFAVLAYGLIIPAAIQLPETQVRPLRAGRL
jgi:hypothetical protein